MDKNYLFLFLFIFILFIPTFLRPESSPIAGADSYYFLNQAFDKTDYDKLTTPISNFIFYNLPQDIILIKVIMFIITVISVFIFYNILKLNNSKPTSFFGSFVLISTVYFSKVFFLLEDDLFGVPFLLIALFYIEKYSLTERKIGHTLTEKNTYLFLSIIYVALATSIWKFCIFYFILFYFFSNFNKIYGLICIFIIPFSKKLVNFIIPNIMVSENRIGIVGIFTAMFFFIVYSRIKNIRYEHIIPIVIFTILYILNSKMMFVIIPILIIALSEIYESDKNIRKTLWIIQVILFIGTINLSIFDFPNNSDYKVLTFCQEKSKKYGLDLEIEWGAGYFAQYNGIDTNYFGHYQKQDYNNNLYYSTSNKANNCIVLKKGNKTTCFFCP